MKKGDQTRQKIVAAAAPIFNRHGYEGSSISELMEATGLQKGGIYRHFASKEELAAEAFDHAWEAAWHARVAHVDEQANAIERLKQFVINFVERRPAIAGGCPVLNTAVDADDGNPVLRARVTEALRSWLAFLESIVRSGIESGEIRPETDPAMVATLIVANLEGGLMMGRLERREEYLGRVREHLNRYLDNEVANRDKVATSAPI